MPTRKGVVNYSVILDNQRTVYSRIMNKYSAQYQPNFAMKQEKVAKTLYF